MASVGQAFAEGGIFMVAILLIGLATLAMTIIQFRKTKTQTSRRSCGA